MVSMDFFNFKFLISTRTRTLIFLIKTSNKTKCCVRYGNSVGLSTTYFKKNLHQSSKQRTKEFFLKKVLKPQLHAPHDSSLTKFFALETYQYLWKKISKKRHFIVIMLYESNLYYMFQNTTV